MSNFSIDLERLQSISATCKASQRKFCKLCVTKCNSLQKAEYHWVLTRANSTFENWSRYGKLVNRKNWNYCQMKALVFYFYHIIFFFKRFSTSGVMTCDPYVKWITSNLSWNIAVTFENSKIDLVLSLHLILYIKLHFTPFVAILWPRTIWILRLTWGSKSYIHASTDR